MVDYPDDAEYRKKNKRALEYIDDTAGPMTFFNMVGDPVHGDQAMYQLHSGIENAKEIYIVSWYMMADNELSRDGWDQPVSDAKRQDVRIAKLLVAAAKRGARVSVLLWNPFNISFPSVTASTDLDALGEIPGPGVESATSDKARDLIALKQLRDDLRAISTENEILFLEHPTSKFASHHQKFWLFRKDKRLWGLVGGINLSQHDWDAFAHDTLEPRRNPPDMEGNERAKRFNAGDFPTFDPRHDWHLPVEGHGAFALLEEFYFRWGQSSIAPPTKPFPKPTDVEQKGTHMVQVSHTWVNDKAPGQILKAYKRAFERAEKYIYCENQYWTNGELTDIIVSRLKQVSNLKVVIVLPDKAEDAIAPYVILPEQYYQLKRMWLAGNAGRFLVYRLFKKHPSRAEWRNVYVHAKVALVDDLWMTVGSANTNNRGMWLETEVNVQLANEELVTKFRKLLWNHLLGGNEGDESDPDQAILKGFHKIGVSNESAKRQNEELRGFILPYRPEDEPPPSVPRLPERLRKYI